MRSEAQEEQALRRLRLMTDFACQTLSAPHTSLSESLLLVYRVRTQAIAMFPDKSATFDMIYGRRFYRILNEKGPLFVANYPFWN